MKTELKDLQGSWKDCTRCSLGRTCRHHVMWDLYRVPNANYQTLPPVDLMVVGEGPGISEDALGKPFVGEAGRVLRAALTLSLTPPQKMTVCLTNLLACRPYERIPSSIHNRAPRPEEVNECRERVVDTIRLMQPRLILAAGKVAEHYLPSMIKESVIKCMYEHIEHPSFIARTNQRKAYGDRIRHIIQTRLMQEGLSEEDLLERYMDDLHD